jgi:EAL and modified HD-GYP domain-containing signal transduction protein
MKAQAGGSWKTFVARQPILDRRKNIFAYELLFRSSLENFCRSDTPDSASSRVMVSSLLLDGLQSIAGGKFAFINFTQNLLIRDFATLLPPDQVVIEILEEVRPNARVLEACKSLKQQGYKLALDDFQEDGCAAPLIPYVDIVKVDWLKTPFERCRSIADELSSQGVKLLAEKVETQEHFRQAWEAGYSYFQGFFFCEPEIVEGQDIPALQTNCMLLLREINAPEPEPAAIERILLHEPSLCYKLLRYLNSSLFYFHGNIASVRHALSLLGTEAVRKWISLVTLAGMGENKPEELVLTSVIRGKFCESIGNNLNMRQNSADHFLMGLFSLIDAILGKPMEKLLNELPISTEIRNTLLGEKTAFRSVYDLVCAYEKSNWEKVTEIATAIKLSEESVANSYVGAVTWAQDLARVSKDIR